MPRIERVRNRHLLKKKQQRKELHRIEEFLGCPVALPEDARMEGGRLDDGSQVLLLDGVILFFESDGRMFPTLHALLANYVSLPRVTVDMGAVKFVANGADIMRPGVTSVEDTVVKDSVVAVVDERHGKPLAVGVSLYDASEMRQLKSGKVVISKHHIGDPFWEFGRG